MQKLIKINTKHYVVVDDSKIEVGDWYIDDAKQIRKSVVSDEVYWQHRPYNREYMKITHSTEPLEDVGLGKYDLRFNKIFALDLDEIKELLGEVDVENRARKEILYNDQKRKWWKQGYNQALEDNKEKKYTEEDMRKAIEFGREQVFENTPIGVLHEQTDNFIQSLQPKTECDVQIVDGKLKLV